MGAVGVGGCGGAERGAVGLPRGAPGADCDRAGGGSPGPGVDVVAVPVHHGAVGV